MIVWRGWGIIVVLFFVAAFFLVDWTTAGKPVGDMMWGEVLLKWSIPILLLSICLYYTGKYLNRSRNQRVGREQTGDVNYVVSRGSNTFFFVPVQHWAWVLAAFGLLFLIPGVREPANLEGSADTEVSQDT